MSSLKGRGRARLTSRSTGPLAYERNRHRVGANAVARDAAGGVGGAEEVLVARRAGGSYASF
jgi:hypothetical protein